MKQSRLTGRHIVVIVLAVCASVALAPTMVYAAKTQLVSIADAKKPSRTAKVDKQRRLQVTGPVAVAPPSHPFHRGQNASDQTPTLGAPIPKGRTLAITSLSSVWLSGMTMESGFPGLRIVVRRANTAGTCPTSGPVAGVVATFFAPGDNSTAQSWERTFPTPQVWRAGNRALCLQVDAGVAGFPVVVDGYLY
jgi:hypothetical protein